MQIIGGRDQVVLTYMGARKIPTADANKFTWQSEMLHQTPAGFQFGHGKDRKIVTSLDEVPAEVFGEVAHKAVKHWLEEDGASKAKQTSHEQDLAESIEQQPGTLDGLAKTLGPGVHAQLFTLLRAAVGGKPLDPSLLAAASSASVGEGHSDITIQRTQGGFMICRPGQPKEFYPGDEEPQLDARGRIIDPDQIGRGEDPVLTGAGVRTASSAKASGEKSLGKELAASRAVHTRQPEKKGKR